MDIQLKKIGINQWQIEKQPGMKADVVIFVKEEMLPQIKTDLSLVQLIQSASLPRVISPVIGMPDIHEGFGLPIGGVMATDNLVSSGAVGMDINCGVRLIATNLTYAAARFSRSFLLDLVRAIEKAVPIGLGGKRREGLPKNLTFEEVVTGGVQTLVKKGYATPDDLQSCEEYGQMPGARIEALSSQAVKRASAQLGTLGSGNHFIEIQRLDKIYDPKLAKAFGLFENQITVMVHCGSRALGQQTCLDYTEKFARAAGKYGIEYPTPNLSALPADSPEGQAYLQAMAACVNFAFANRQFITHQIRRIFDASFRKDNLKLMLVYDVAHNIAKWEEHRGKKLLIHRKGATRALPAGHRQNPQKYAQTGHPAIVPGSMGTASFVMAGLPLAEKTFYSVNHGAGRRMSRHEAQRTIKKEEFDQVMKDIVYNKPFRVISDEAPQAYKDINLVTETLVEAGIAQKVARIRPLAVIKGD
ncbi:MAG TPA: RtcB family protein [Candidatus Bathyarchaeia archaeon]|nr:RtcB family protein [Candidatus Bathyarchaeia archaeon]